MILRFYAIEYYYYYLFYSSCSSTDELLRESLLISKLKPTLNQQGSSIPLSLL
jgi:hypothetical protein